MDSAATYCLRVIAWPCLSQGEWAAWMQAILSVVAIVAAGLFPLAHAHVERRRRIETYVALIRHALRCAKEDSRQLGDMVDEALVEPLNAYHWHLVMQAFSNVPYHELPDSRLFEPVHRAATASEAFWNQLTRIAGVGREGQIVLTEDVAVLNAVRRQLDKACRDAHAIGSVRGRWGRRSAD